MQQKRKRKRFRGDWRLPSTTAPKSTRFVSYDWAFSGPNKSAFKVIDNMCLPDMRRDDWAVIYSVPGLLPKPGEYALLKIGEFPKTVRRAVLTGDGKLAFEIARTEAGLKYEIYGIVVAIIRGLRK